MIFPGFQTRWFFSPKKLPPDFPKTSSHKCLKPICTSGCNRFQSAKDHWMSASVDPDSGVPPVICWLSSYSGITREYNRSRRISTNPVIEFGKKKKPTGKIDRVRVSFSSPIVDIQPPQKVNQSRPSRWDFYISRFRLTVIPQGTMPAPTLILRFVNDLLPNLSNTIRSFSDDATLECLRSYRIPRQPKTDIGNGHNFISVFLDFNFKQKFRWGS